MHVDEFMKMNAAEKSSRFSQLTPFREDILKLKNEGFTERKILEFLALNNVVVNQSTLHRFVKRQTENKPQNRSEKTAAAAKKPGKVAAPSVAPAVKSYDPNKPSWVPSHIDIDALMRKD